MLRLGLLLCLSSTLIARAASPAADHDRAVDSWLKAQLAGLLKTYRHLHANPELSLHERETAALVAREFGDAGYSVTPSVGGHGVVGVLKNGPGPTVLVRGDMDALPITEQTGLAHASRVKATTNDGQQVGVMHACGHDVHVTTLIGTARLLAEHRALWSGTLLVIAQPAEELGLGAKMMIDDGLFRRFPRPDYALALHVDSEMKAGTVGYVPGWAAANVDSVDITVFGRGGHGARPHQANDPVVTAAHLVTALQSIVSRRVDPQKPAVVTVGSIHGGSKHNIIPDQVNLQLTVRSYSDDVRKQLLDGIRQIAIDTCKTYGCPKPAKVRVKENYTPAVYNDPSLTARAAAVFGRVLGANNVQQRRPTMGGEDFGRYPRALGVPGLQYRLGAVAPRRLGEPRLPSLHSSKFAPDASPTLRTGIRSMAHLALSLMPRSAP